MNEQLPSELRADAEDVRKLVESWMPSGSHGDALWVSVNDAKKLRAFVLSRLSSEESGRSATPTPPPAQAQAESHAALKPCPLCDSPGMESVGFRNAWCDSEGACPFGGNRSLVLPRSVWQALPRRSAAPAPSVAISLALRARAIVGRGYDNLRLTLDDFDALYRFVRQSTEHVAQFDLSGREREGAQPSRISNDEENAKPFTPEGLTNPSVASRLGRSRANKPAPGAAARAKAQAWTERAFDDWRHGEDAKLRVLRHVTLLFEREAELRALCSAAIRSDGEARRELLRMQSQGPLGRPLADPAPELNSQTWKLCSLCGAHMSRHGDYHGAQFFVHPANNCPSLPGDGYFSIIPAGGAEAAQATSRPYSLRDEVFAFAQAMEEQLRANDHKPGWKDDDPDDLIARITDETVELTDVVNRRFPRKGLILNEAADVANFAMMVADVCGALPAGGPEGGSPSVCSDSQESAASPTSPEPKTTPDLSKIAYPHAPGRSSPETVRVREVAWCSALIATLEIEDVDRVLRKYLELRDVPAPTPSPEEPRDASTEAAR